MNALKSLNKEQWSAAIAVGIGALMLLMGFAGGLAPGAEVPTGGPERNYEGLRARFTEIPDDKWERYGQGPHIFATQSSSRLSIPPLAPPEPREEELPAPMFRPSPVFDAYNRLSVPSKYPSLGTAIVAEANLPPAAEVDALKKLEEPAPVVRPDRRAERPRQFLVIIKTNGTKFEGTAITHKDAEILIYRDKTGNRMTLKRSDIKEVLTNDTFEEQYRLNTAKVNPGPREADERLKLAQQALEWGMMKEAREELEKVLEAKKDHLEAILLLGQLSVEAADFESAMAAYRAGLDAGAPAAELHYEIGRCLRSLGLTEAALGEFEKAAEFRHHRAKLALARAQVEAGQHVAGGDTAADFFTKLGNSPDTTPAHRAEAHLVRGLAALRGGALDKAKSDFAETLKIEAQSAEAMNGLGVVAALEGQYPQAAPEFVKAIRANQYLTEAWTNLAAIFLLGGKWAEAEALYAAALQRDAAAVDAALGQGLAQLMAGKKEAPATIERAAAMDTRNLQVHMVSGLLRLREGADEEALQRFVAALRAEWHYLPAYSGAAAAYLRTARKLGGSRDEAREKKAQEMRVNAETLLTTLRDFDPARPGSSVALGCAYAAMGRADVARQAFRNAASLLQAASKPLDPLIYYGLGFVEYYYGQAETDEKKLELAHPMFADALKLKAEARDGFSQRVIADCELAIEQIENWRVTGVLISDNFDRDSSPNLGTGWVKDRNQYGIELALEGTKDRGGRARFAGKQAIRDMGITRLSRDFPGDDFHSMEITFYPDRREKAEYGVSIFHTVQGQTQVGFHVGVDQQGKVRINPQAAYPRDMERDMTLGWVEVKTPLPNAKEVTLRLTRADRKPQGTVLTLSFWDPAKSQWVLGQANIAPGNLGSARGTWTVSAWVRGQQNSDILVYVDNVRVFERARR